jgi:hypothetical protein
MSYPYPQDRHRDRKEKGEQPYKDAKEAMAQQEAEVEGQITAQNAPDIGPTSTDEISDEANERLRRVNEEIVEEHGERST